MVTGKKNPYTFLVSCYQTLFLHNYDLVLNLCMIFSAKPLCINVTFPSRSTYFPEPMYSSPSGCEGRESGDRLGFAGSEESSGDCQLSGQGSWPSYSFSV